MSQNSRMSPWTAFFIGAWSFGVAAIAAGAGITLHAMAVIDDKASMVLDLASNTIADLPELVEALPTALGEILHDRRAPEYIEKLAIDADFVPGRRSDGMTVALTIKNTGSKVVSLLAVRVAA